MSDLPQTRENVVVEEVSLNLLPGSGETQNSSAACNRVTGQQDRTSCCHDKNHRRLTFCSIICGISCIGIYALINSVKAEEAADPERAARFSQRAKKLSIISIVVWVTILAMIPILVAFISYLLTLRD